MKEKIIDTIIYIVFIALAVLTVIYQHNLKAVLIIFSASAVIIGLLNVINKKKFGAVVLLIGFNILITYFLYAKNILVLPKAITFLVSLTIAMVLIMGLCFDLFNTIKLKKKFCLNVEGTVIDLIKEPNTNREYYMPLYEYKVHDKVYQVLYPKFINRFLPQLGSIKNICVDPNSPDEVYFFPSKIDSIFNIVFSILFSIICVIIIITMFR